MAILKTETPVNSIKAFSVAYSMIGNFEGAGWGYVRGGIGGGFWGDQRRG
jgi:hypothetical protein